MTENYFPSPGHQYNAVMASENIIAIQFVWLFLMINILVETHLMHPVHMTTLLLQSLYPIRNKRSASHFPL